MTRKTQDDWLKLIDEQSKGDLSVADFCKYHHLGQTYFYKRKSDLKKLAVKQKSSSFIKVLQATADSEHRASIQLHYQKHSLSVPVNISPAWLAQFVKALA